MKLVPGTLIKFSSYLTPMHRDKTGEVIELQGGNLVAMCIGTEILKINHARIDFGTKNSRVISDWCLCIKLLCGEKNIYRVIKTFTSLEDAKAFASTGNFHKLVERTYSGLEVEVIEP